MAGELFIPSQNGDVCPRHQAIIYAQLGTPGRTDLLAAFAKITDGEARRAVLKVAQDLGQCRKAAANAA